MKAGRNWPRPWRAGSSPEADSAGPYHSPQKKRPRACAKGRKLPRFSKAPAQGGTAGDDKDVCHLGRTIAKQVHDSELGLSLMQILGQFPAVRMRRMRRDDFSRRLMRENTVSGRRFHLSGIRPRRRRVGASRRLDAGCRAPFDRRAAAGGRRVHPARHSGDGVVSGHRRQPQGSRRTRGKESPTGSCRARCGR